MDEGPCRAGPELQGPTSSRRFTGILLAVPKALRVKNWGPGNEAVFLETLLSHYTADTLVSLLTFLVRATH